jgi:DNA-binding MarR family transcriptional regulator
MAKPSVSAERDAPANGILPSHRVPSFLSYLLRQVCLGIMAEVLAPADLRPVEYATLTTIDAEPGIDQRKLATRIACDKMSTSQLVERLEGRGLITRRVDSSDRRARVLHLTPKGLALRRRLRPAALAAQDRILAPLRPEERPVLIDLIARVIEGHATYARPGNGRRGPRKSASSAP